MPPAAAMSPLRVKGRSTSWLRRRLWVATSAFGTTYEETWQNMPAEAELKAKLQAMGIWDEGLSLEAA